MYNAEEKVDIPLFVALSSEADFSRHPVQTILFHLLFAYLPWKGGEFLIFPIFKQFLYRHLI